MNPTETEVVAHDRLKKQVMGMHRALINSVTGTTEQCDVICLTKFISCPAKIISTVMTIQLTSMI